MLILYVYWIVALIPIPCGQIILTISFTLAGGLPLFCWTVGDSNMQLIHFMENCKDNMQKHFGLERMKMKRPAFFLC